MLVCYIVGYVLFSLDKFETTITLTGLGKRRRRGLADRGHLRREDGAPQPVARGFLQNLGATHRSRGTRHDALQKGTVDTRCGRARDIGSVLREYGVGNVSCHRRTYDRSNEQ